MQNSQRGSGKENMIVIKELIYFMFALILLCVLLCLLIWCGWLLNTLCKELLDIDLISLLKWRGRRVSDVMINTSNLMPKTEVREGKKNETIQR